MSAIRVIRVVIATVLLLIFTVFCTTYIIRIENEYAVGKLRDKVEALIQLCKQPFRIDSNGRLNIAVRKSFNPIRNRNGIYFPANICQLSGRLVDRLLTTNHNCSRGGYRFWLHDTWMTAKQLTAAIAAPDDVNPIRCIVICVQDSVPCHDRSCLIPLYLRVNTSDIAAAMAVFEEGELDIVKSSWDLRTILDAGAGIGVSTIVFATMYPEAKIVSLEPSRDKFDVLLLNSQRFHNVIPLHAALTSSLTRIRIPATNLKSKVKQNIVHGYSGTELTVPGVSVDALLNMFTILRVDFAKIDIAGREQWLFESIKRKKVSWLDEVSMVMVAVYKARGKNESVSDTFKLKASWLTLGWWRKYKVFKMKGFDI